MVMPRLMEVGLTAFGCEPQLLLQSLPRNTPLQDAMELFRIHVKGRLFSPATDQLRRRLTWLHRSMMRWWHRGCYRRSNMVEDRLRWASDMAHATRLQLSALRQGHLRCHWGHLARHLRRRARIPVPLDRHPTHARRSAGSLRHLVHGVLV